MLAIQHWLMGSGRFLPESDLDTAQTRSACSAPPSRASCSEHAPRSAQWVRIGDMRCRVLGVLAQQGLAGGFNVDETVIMPVASAQQIFNTSAVFRILVEANGLDAVQAARRDIIEIVKQRHAGEEDITVVTQDALRHDVRHDLQHDHGGPRRDRRDQPRRRRRADHERHARRREPAHGGDRPAEGGRRAQPRRSSRCS